MVSLCLCRYVLLLLHIFRKCTILIYTLFTSIFLPDSFGNYSHYVFSLMDVNDTGRINFQVQNVQKIPMIHQNPIEICKKCTFYIPHYDHYPGLPGDAVNHGTGLDQGEDAVGGQAL